MDKLLKTHLLKQINETSVQERTITGWLLMKIEKFVRKPNPVMYKNYTLQFGWICPRNTILFNIRLLVKLQHE